MAAVRCEKGPLDGQPIENYSPVPSRRVPVYAAASSGTVCDDEQVVSLLGYYVRYRTDCGQPRCNICPYYTYLWTTRRDLIQWAEGT